MKLKNVTFLMSAMLVLTLSSFGQDFRQIELKAKYADYIEKSNAYLKANNSTDKPLSYNKWLASIGQDTITLTNKQKTLHNRYDYYFDYIGSKKVPLSYNDWLKKENLVDISGVDYVKQPNIKTVDSIHRKYDNYYDNLTYYKKIPMSYQDWLTKNNYVDEYPNSYTRTTQQTSQIKKFNLSSGDYLIKAKRQMISGYVFDFIGVGAILVSPNEGGFMVGGACGLIGLIC